MSGFNGHEPVAPPASYVEQAVADECRKVEQAAMGAANQTLHQAASALGTIVGAGWLPRCEAEERLEAAAAVRGKSRSEARATIKSGLDWGVAHPRQQLLRSTVRDKNKSSKTEHARRVWEDSHAIGGTLAETYLRTRGMHGRLPESLRFTPSVRMPGGITAPALLAMIVDPTSGRFVGVQRTALAADGTTKATIETPKASLGSTAGGAVVLGALDGAANIFEGEGIETVLSACQATGLPGIATLSAGTLGKPQLPEACSVIILGDRGSEKAADAGARRRSSEGRSVRIAYTPEGQCKDFNDLLRSSGCEAVKAAVDTATAYIPEQPSRPYTARCLADIDARPIDWLWPERIARGKLNLLAGHPGRGKSTLTLFMAALVSTGGRWPDGSLCPLGNVVFVTCEDDAADTLVPRLCAAEANLRRCLLLDAVSDGKDGLRPFNLKTDAGRIEELAKDIGGLALVVIDPISAYLNGIDSHNVAEARGALVPLQQAAERVGAAVVLVSHFNKGTPDGSAMSRVAGSGAFVAVCRSAWAIDRDPEEPDGNRRILAPMKNNIGDDRTGFVFEVEQCNLGNGITGSRVRFQPGTVHISADELVRSQSQSSGKKTALSKASAFLSDLLAQEALPQSMIEAMAKNAGHKKRTLQRVKEALGIESQKRADGWWWKLPEGATGGPDLFDDQDRQGCQGGQNSCGKEFGEVDAQVSPEAELHSQDSQLGTTRNRGDLGDVGCLEGEPPLSMSEASV